jgi:phospholipase/carboxylesterase
MPIEHRERPAAGDPEGALVLMHGRGTDENDLFPLFDMLDPDRRLLGLAPRGPLSLPPGGAHWYAVAQIGYPDPATFWDTYPEVTRWLDTTLAEHGLDHSQTVLGGFSQGGVMSYALGLAADRPAPRAIVAMSSFIPTVDGLELELERDVPEAIAHGTLDPIIGVEWGRDARDRLTEAGSEPLYREYQMGHTVHPDFLEDARDFIHRASRP